jgi:hypothetical protein
MVEVYVFHRRQVNRFQGYSQLKMCQFPSFKVYLLVVDLASVMSLLKLVPVSSICNTVESRRFYQPFNCMMTHMIFYVHRARNMYHYLVNTSSSSSVRKLLCMPKQAKDLPIVLSHFRVSH